jgi:hypothetical protein
LGNAFAISSSRRFCKLDQLRLFVDVGQRRGDAFIGEQPLESGLPECAFFALQKAQAVDLLDSIQQPTARAMKTMISRRENSILGAFAFQHSG